MIPNTLFLREIFADDRSYVWIHKATAVILQGDSTLKGVYHIQLTDHDGTELDHPIIWRYQAWLVDKDRWTAKKAALEKEREDRWIFEENVRRVQRAFMRKFRIDEGPARAAAWRLVTETPVDNVVFTELLRVKLALTIEEIK